MLRDMVIAYYKSIYDKVGVKDKKGVYYDDGTVIIKENEIEYVDMLALSRDLVVRRWGRNALDSFFYFTL